MPPTTAHLIVRATDGGIFARSPQCPGLTFGRGTISEVKDETQAVLAPPTATPELALRWPNVSSLRCDHAQRAELLAYPPGRTGEHLFIAVVAADSLGWIAEQLDDKGDPAVIAAPATDLFIWTNLVGYGKSAANPVPVPSESVADLPRGAATTVADMMRTDLVDRRPLVLSRA